MLPCYRGFSLSGAHVRDPPTPTSCDLLNQGIRDRMKSLEPMYRDPPTPTSCDKKDCDGKINGKSPCPEPCTAPGADVAAETAASEEANC